MTSIFKKGKAIIPAMYDSGKFVVYFHFLPLKPRALERREKVEPNNFNLNLNRTKTPN